MDIETFECQETVCEPIEATEEAIELIKKCKLKGQKQLITTIKEESTKTKVRNPYREMTKDEVEVYSILCPNYFDIDEYSVAPIPLRILQVISHARGYFKFIEIWDGMIWIGTYII